MMRALGLGLSLPAASALLAACNDDGGGTAAAPKGGRLRVRLLNDIEDTRPGDVFTGQDGYITDATYQKLVEFVPNTDFERHNVLAKSFEGSADGLRWNFKLREGVMFHKGYGELTARDVKATFEEIAGLTGNEHGYAADWAALEKVVVDGKYEGTIHLKEPYSPLLTTTVPWEAGGIMSARAIKKLGDKLKVQPIGTGRYEFVEFVPGERVVLKRFKDYWGDDPGAWDEIRFSIITKDSAAEIALEAGDLDVAQISLPGVSRFEGNDDFDVTESKSLNFDWVGMNMLHDNLKDVNVRQAIRYAIDVPGILEAVYDGRAERAYSALAPGMPVGYWEDAPRYERDLDKAREFMAEAGVDQLELTIRASNDETRSIAEVVQANLAEIDIKVEIVFNENYDLGPKLREQQLAVMEYVGVAPDPIWATQWFRCAQFDEWNWMYWCDDEYDKLDAAATKVVDPAKRTENYIRMQELWDQAVNSVWIAHPSYFFAARRGLKLATLGGGELYADRIRPA